MIILLCKVTFACLVCGSGGGSEDNMRPSVLVYHVSPRSQTQVGRFGGKCSHLLGCLTNLFFFEDLHIFKSFCISIHHTLHILPMPRPSLSSPPVSRPRQVYFYFRVIHTSIISQRDDPEEVFQAKIEYLKHICDTSKLCCDAHFYRAHNLLRK